jgi:hypothetical protein
MMKFRLASCCLALFVAVSAVGSLQAGFTPYFTQADFQNAINSGGLITTANIDFNSLATGSLGGPSFSTSGVGFSVPVANGINLSINNDPPATSKYLGSDDLFNAGDFAGSDVLTITMPAGSRGIGLNIITIGDISLQDASNNQILTVGGGLASTNTSTAGAQANATNLGVSPNNYSSFFLGLLGTSGAGDAITVATISGINATNFYRVDNVIVAAVPEPSSLMLAGFAGVMCLARRRIRR